MANPSSLAKNLLLVSLFLPLFIVDFLLNSSSTPLAYATTHLNNATAANTPTSFELDCPPGEERQFNYKSSTRVWGSGSQQVRFDANLRLRCMVAAKNGTLKYMGEILSIVPDFTSAHQQTSTRTQQSSSRLPQSAGIDPNSLQAEPLLEEVGELADRMKRSVSGWFSKTWTNVKDFFSNLFNSSERSSVSRDQAFKDTGLDIMGQCKSNSKRPKDTALPFDESVFDDLGPEYYSVGASLDGTAYEFSTANENKKRIGAGEPTKELNDYFDEPLNQLSFFDDPKVADTVSGSGGGELKSRARRAAAASGTSRLPVADLSRQISLPFIFIQSKSGKIIEIQFSGEETDLSVRNFKRHLCDLFATNTLQQVSARNETSPIGKHQTDYLLDSSKNSTNELKQSVISASKQQGDEQSTKQLVRALAMIGQQTGATSQSVGRDPNLDGDDDDANHHHLETDPIRTGLVSVLRTINTTTSLQTNSILSGDQMRVQSSQIQELNEGRLTGTAGQLRITLVKQDDTDPRRQRVKRSSDGQPVEQLEDIYNLVQVATSFSLKMIPFGNDPGQSGPPSSVEHKSGKLRRRHERAAIVPLNEGEKLLIATVNKSTTSSFKHQSRRKATNVSSSSHWLPLVKRPPSDLQELEKTLEAWKRLEADLQMSSTSLIAENNGPEESQLDRLEILRDQVRLRLNEEYLRNRIRRSLGVRQEALRVASASSTNSKLDQRRSKLSDEKSRKAPSESGDFGLGLTQLVLGTGITTRQKGSIYSTIEEVMELESSLPNGGSLGQSPPLDSVSRLFRETIRWDRLADHCKSSLDYPKVGPKLGHQHTSEHRRLELRHPFGLRGDDEAVPYDNSSRGSRNDEFKRPGAGQGSNSGRPDKFEQCKRVLRLLVKLSQRQAGDLVLELIDECNQQLMAVAKSEELGHGPMGKHYRHLRQQLVELMAHFNRPSDQLLDKLMVRLYHPRLANLTASSGAGSRTRTSTNSKSPAPFRTATGVSRPADELPEFVHVPVSKIDGKLSRQPNGGPNSWSILREEDDINNNEAAGALVSTLASLAAKRTISRSKRLEVIERLLNPLKQAPSCSLIDGPDLDILEAMGSFVYSPAAASTPTSSSQQQSDTELVTRVLQLARKCKHSDLYLVACVHALAGQLHNSSVQRFLVDLLRSPNSTCTLKSEIVLTLTSVQLSNDLKQQRQQPLRLDHSAAAGKPRQTTLPWPSSASDLNQVDSTLWDLVDGTTGAPTAPATTGQMYWDSKRRLDSDRRCLKQLVVAYLWTRRADQLPAHWTSTLAGWQAPSPTVDHQLIKRAIVNENNFWDEAKCRRWTIGLPDNPELHGPASEGWPHLEPANGTRAAPNSSIGLDLVDELDDYSLMSALINGQQAGGRASGRRQPALAGEPEPTAGFASSAPFRRRHKCQASKSFGPRNAQATLSTEIVNDLIGHRDENKFLARFKLATDFLGHKIDVGRMYLWHQRRTTRAHANILGRSLWDTAHQCDDKAPHQALYMPLFDVNLWLVKISLGLRLNAEMGFYSNCKRPGPADGQASGSKPDEPAKLSMERLPNDELELHPTISLRASGEATAKFVMLRAGMSLASQYAYRGSIRVGRQPDSCMSVYSGHEPMNVTFSSWFQMWDNDCHFWGSRGRAEPQAIKWRLPELSKPIAWLEDECLVERPRAEGPAPSSTGSPAASNSSDPSRIQAKKRSIEIK